MNINLKELKEIDLELLKEIIDKIPQDIDLEDATVTVDDKIYTFQCIDGSDWEDDGRGKYYFKTSMYVLSLVDVKYDLLEKYNVIVYQSVTKTGSYYTDWYYDYDEPTFRRAVEKVIPEQTTTIPEHTIIEFESLNLLDKQ